MLTSFILSVCWKADSRLMMSDLDTGRLLILMGEDE